jgi:hypothetical protein
MKSYNGQPYELIEVIKLAYWEYITTSYPEDMLQLTLSEGVYLHLVQICQLDERVDKADLMILLDFIFKDKDIGEAYNQVNFAMDDYDDGITQDWLDMRLKYIINHPDAPLVVEDRPVKQKAKSYSVADQILYAQVLLKKQYLKLAKGWYNDLASHLRWSSLLFLSLAVISGVAFGYIYGGCFLFGLGMYGLAMQRKAKNIKRAYRATLRALQSPELRSWNKAMKRKSRSIPPQKLAS